MKLKEDEALWRTIIDQSREFIGLTSIDGILIEVNRAALEMVGASAVDVLNKPFWDTPWWSHSAALQAQLRAAVRTAAAGEPVRFEATHPAADSSLRYVDFSIKSVKDESGNVLFLIAEGNDITERKQSEELIRLNELRLETLLELNRMTGVSESELAHFAMESAVRLTKSTIGYVAFMNEAETILTMYAWSSQAMRECAIVDKPIVYPVATTGLWGEAVRQRRAVITNDYAAPNTMKKGVPEGHVHVIRHMNTPIFDGDRIVIVAGVGNKPTDYGDDDVRQLTLLMSGMWTILCRKRAEEALRQNRNMLDLVLNTIPQSVFWKDRDSWYLGCNLQFARDVGLEHPDEIVGKTDFDLPWPREEADGYRSDDRYVMDNNCPKPHIIEPLQQADGSRLWIDTSKTPLVDGQGNVYGVLGVYEDITERKKAEEESRIFMESVENSSDAVGMSTPQGKHYYQNRAFDVLFGQVGERPADSVYFDPAVGHEVFRTIMAGGQWTGEVQMYAKDRKVLDILLRAYANKDKGGRITALVGIHTDITSRKRAEEALRESEERFRSTFDQAAVGIAHVSPNGRFMRINQRFCNIIGYTQDEIVTLTFQDITLPEDLETDLEYVHKLIEDRIPHYSMEKRYIRKDKSLLWVNLTVALLRGSDGMPKYFISVIEDIGKRKEAEEELRQSEARLNAILSSMKDIVFEIDLNGRFEGYYAQKNKGFYVQPELFFRKKYDEVLPESVSGMLQQAIETIYAGEPYQQFEYSITINNTLQYENAVVTPRYNASNEIIGVTVVCRNITKRFQVEETLREREATLRAVLESTADAVLVEDDRDAVIHFNARFTDLWRMPPEVVEGGNAQAYRQYILNQVADLDGFLGRIQALYSSSLPMFETFQLKDARILEWSSSPLRIADRIAGRVWTFRDITERKRAEEALRVESERFTALARASNTGVWEWHRASGFLWCSAEYFAMLGRDAADFDLSGQPNLEETWLDLLHPEDRERAGKHFADYLADGSPGMYENFFRMQHRNGSWVWIWSRGTTLRDTSGHLTDKTVGTHINITEQKAAEAEIIAQRERLQNIAANVPGVVYQFYALSTGGYGISYVSERATEVLELKIHPETTFAEFVNRIHPDDREAFITSIRQVVATVSPWRYEGRFVKPSGSVLWFVATSNPTRLPDRIVFDGLLLDITERKRAEEALRESEQRYRELVTNANSVILRMDSKGFITFFNEFAQRLFGYTADEVLGRNVVGTIVPETDSAGRDLRSMILDITHRPSLYAQHENENMKRDGSRVWISWTNTPIFSTAGEILEILCIGNDITARRQAEDALRQDAVRRQRRADLIAHVASMRYTAEGAVEDLARELTKGASHALEVERVGVWLFNEDQTQLVSVDTYEASRSAHTSGAVMQRSEFQKEFEVLLNAKYIDANDAIADPRTKGYFENYLKPNNIISMLDVAIRIEGRNLGTLCVEHVNRPHHWREDEIVFCCQLADQVALAILHRMRRRAEEERERLQSQLAQAQKMESVGRLAGGVAHDFNNMLGVILGHTEMVLEQVGLNDPLRADLEDVQRAAQRSADLTRQLLAFARKQTVAPKVLDLNETVAGMLKLLRRLIGEDIDLLWKPGHEVWPVMMDPAQLDQILANLCVNGRDAIAGVGTVIIETENTSIRDECNGLNAGLGPGDYVMLAVSDDGCGMDAETLSQIFEPFFTTKEMGKGTGLGLATVYGAVKQNNGFITVNSDPGLGTTFRIYLPRHVAKIEEETGKLTHLSAVRGAETILLVEDDPAILRMTKALLNKLGYTVLTANTPGEALRVAREYSGRIDLLMTDVVMPEMNGRDLAQNLLSNRPGIQRLFMSGYTADVIAHHGVLDEGVHFISKPFSTKDLAVKIRKALEKG